LAAGWRIQAVDQLGAGLGMQNVPGLGFAMEASCGLDRVGVGVVGVNLDRKGVAGVDEFGQQREIGAAAGKVLRADQRRALLARQLGQRAAGVGSIGDAIMLVHLPRLGQVVGRV